MSDRAPSITSVVNSTFVELGKIVLISIVAKLAAHFFCKVSSRWVSARGCEPSNKTSVACTPSVASMCSACLMNMISCNVSEDFTFFRRRVSHAVSSWTWLAPGTLTLAKSAIAWIWSILRSRSESSAFLLTLRAVDSLVIHSLTVVFFWRPFI